MKDFYMITDNVRFESNNNMTFEALTGNIDTSCINYVQKSDFINLRSFTNNISYLNINSTSLT